MAVGWVKHTSDRQLTCLCKNGPELHPVKFLKAVYLLSAAIYDSRILTEYAPLQSLLVQQMRCVFKMASDMAQGGTRRIPDTQNSALALRCHGRATCREQQTAKEALSCSRYHMPGYDEECCW